jgi:hypothetical protein
VSPSSGSISSWKVLTILLGLHDPEDEGSMILQNDGTYLPADMVLHPGER